MNNSNQGLASNVSYKRMKMIYVAGPYVGKDSDETEKNIERAEKASVELLKLGWVVVTPHKNTAHYEKYHPYLPYTYEFYLTRDFEIIKRCDAVFVLNNYINSQGTLAEINFCIENNVPYFFEEELHFPIPEDVEFRV